MTRCRSCETPIEWRSHERTRKKAPVELEAHADGNVVKVGATRYRVLSKKEMATDPGPRYRLHFATCPEADTFRRRDPVAHREKETT